MHVGNLWGELGLWALEYEGCHLAPLLGAEVGVTPGYLVYAVLLVVRYKLKSRVVADCVQEHHA